MVQLTIDAGGHWVVAQDGDHVYRARTEYAKSSRAKCRFCSEAIMKDTLRVGKAVKWADWITSWRHPKCFYVEDGDGPISDEETFGMEILQEEDKEAARVALSRLKPPVVDESLNPENPDFVKHTVKAKAETPARMTTKLLPFQQEGLRWLLDQEMSEIGGGLLCDEMGMGKTIQTLSLIVASKYGEAAPMKDESKRVKKGPTLVVTPSSAMLQWKDEVENVTQDNTLSVLVYYGSNRGALTPEDLRKHDIVLTSYPILEYEYRRCVDRCKVECKYCHKRFLPRKLIVHNQYFCGPNSKRSAKLALRDKKETAAKKQRAMDKAMATLDIINNGANEDASSGKGNAANGKGKGRGKAARKHSLPTMTNIYRDLMEEANREPTGFYSSKEEAQRQAAASMRKREIKKETNPASDNNSKSDARSTEEAGSDDFEEETNVRERRNLWATDDGSFFFYKHKGKTWGCNAGITLTGLRTSPVVLQSTNTNGVDSFQVKFLNGAGAAQLSIDNGETWSNWVNGRWITPKKGRLNVDERKEGWQSSGPKMGALLARTFDKKTILAAIVAHAPAEDTADDEESPALWRIEHTDGDEEDLEVIEVKEAEQLFSQAFAPSTVVSTTLAKPLISALEALSQDTAPLAKSKGRRASAAAANKKMKAKKAATAKKTKKGDEDDEDADGGSDSDFEPKSSSDDNGDDDEGDEDNEDNADGSENVDEDSDEKPKILDLKPCFRPVEWGPGSKDAKFLALFKTHFSTKTGKSKKVKAKKRKRKANARSATPSKSSKGAKGASAKSVPGPKAKSKILDESSEESDFESSDSSDEEDEIDAGLGVDLQEAKDRCEGDLFWFAPPGDIVDDDGIDMGSSILHCIGWNRIVLDEAHKIKDRVNSTAKAVLALRGTPVVDLDKRWPDGGPCHRWCLSGTPLQNRVGDLYSLVRFLRVDPYAFYLCKVAGCECRSLHWAMGRGGRVCDGCGHPPMRHYSYFNKVVVNPIKRNGYVGEGRMAMKLLRDDVLAKIMLRRTKKERQADIKLPPCTVEVRNLKFTEHERDFYESVYKNTRAKFDTYVGKGTVLHNYAHIFELLSRLRRAADHPYLVVHGAGDDPFGTSKAAGDRTKRTDICGICQFDIETLEEVAVSQCKHTFHRNCVDDFIAKFQGSNNNDDDDDDDDDDNVTVLKQSKQTSKQRSVVRALFQDIY